jgi:hypothetical protein
MNRTIIAIVLAYAPIAAALPADDGAGTTGVIRGVTQNLAGEPLAEVRVAICNMNENSPQMTLSGSDGKFLLAGLKPGQYQITAQADGYETELPITVDVSDQQAPDTTVPLAKTDPKDAKKPAGFFSRLAKAYYDDWHPGPDGPDAKHRFYDPPESNPPYPFAVWPIGGFVARASRRAASTVVSTFFSAVTAKSMSYPLFSTERSALG